MSQTVKITIAAAGTDTGPFNLFSNADSYANAFETGVLKANLLAGYTSSAVPDAATVVRVKSNSVGCTNYVDMTITSPPPPSSITFTVNNISQFPYPINGSNGSASGTITNNSGSTIYIYAYFQSAGNTSGTINGDGGSVAGGAALTIPSGPITSSGQAFYSTNYETLPSNNVTVNWSLSKQDGFTNGATLSLVYSTTVGGTKIQLNP
jgi:hypothetical protein